MPNKQEEIIEGSLCFYFERQSGRLFVSRYSGGKWQGYVQVVDYAN